MLSIFVHSAALTLLTFSLSLPHARADETGNPSIEYVYVGFHPSEATSETRTNHGLFKAGFWVPIRISVHSGNSGINQGRVHVETTDSEGTPNIYTVPLPATGIQPNQTHVVWAYTRTGSVACPIKVTLECDDQRVQAERTFESVPAGNELCLCLGSQLPGLARALALTSAETGTSNFTNCRVMHIADVQSLPDRWFGYRPIDLAILPTANRQFVEELRSHAEQKNALADWLRRGGHLLISCGRNRESLDPLLRELDIPVPVSVDGPLPVRALDHLRTWTVGHHSFPIPIDTFENGSKLSIERGEPYEWLLPARENEQSTPLVVRWPCGIGQVILVAFDLDEGAFTEWAGQTDFWKVLLPKCGIKPAPQAAANIGQDSGDTGATDVSTQLQHRLDSFREIAVVPFGWIALFILLLIAVLGPLDYYILNLCTKRLELTWISFPLVVAAVTAGACYGAYALKGSELRINKTDLVDIDLTELRSYGTTWFTIYSPRTDNFTVNIEPAAPRWAKNADGIHGGTVMTWFGRPEEGYGGYLRPRSQAVFQRTYQYAHEARGLEGVPVPVWSSKSFTAEWIAEFRPDQPLPRIHRRENTLGLAGIVTNPLPAVLTEAALIYGENENQVKVYQLGTMVPGQAKTVAAAPEAQLSQWLSPVSQADETGRLLRRIMFYDATTNVDGIRNHALQHLDQSWRRSLRNTAMLVGQVASIDGSIENVSDDPASPSRLRLRMRSEYGGDGTTSNGRLTQNTVVRILVPLTK